MPQNLMVHRGLFTGYHYAVHASYHNRRPTLEFFEREPEAIKDAKLKLYNCSRVTVYSLEDCTFVGKAILESRSAKKKLVKLKEYQIKDGE